MLNSSETEIEPTETIGTRCLRGRISRVIAVMVMALLIAPSLAAERTSADSDTHYQSATADDIGVVPGFPLRHHLDQHTITRTPVGEITELGQKLFNATYNLLDGAGANLSGDAAGTIRFTRLPRMDLPGFASNPTRTSGPNSQNCVACHHGPYPGGAGALIDKEIRDSLRIGDPRKYIQRDPLSLFGSGALQLLAEQFTQELKTLRESAIAKARRTGQSVSVDLVTSNIVNYGRLVARPSGEIDTSGVSGIDPDLIVRPYTWKGAFMTFLRPLVSLGTDTEMGLQSVEFFGENTDFDNDGFVNEMTVGDITAMTLYIATLPRPVEELELSSFLGGQHRLPPAQIAAIQRGEKMFSTIGCASCHQPTMKLKNPQFREPSAFPEHRFPMFPSGQNPVALGLDPRNPVVVDLALNPQVGNVRNDAACRENAARYSRENRSGNFCFLQYEIDRDNDVVVSLYGDLKRHDMGPGLAENIDEAGTGSSVWKTRELWGTGSTGPWLHDGRATTLDEAILWHGGEAETARNRYVALSGSDKRDVIRFLKNLILFTPDSTR